MTDYRALTTAERLALITDLVATELEARVPHRHDQRAATAVWLDQARVLVLRTLALEQRVPSVDELGAHFGVSGQTLGRYVAEHGTTLRDLIQNARYSVVLPLLEQDLPISAISTAVGFARPEAFARWFKQHSGVTPRALLNTWHSGAQKKVKS